MRNWLFGGWAWLLGACCCCAQWAAADSLFDLRRQYNGVAASIDTLSRLYGDQDLEKVLARQPGRRAPGADLVLVFWADDEAEVFLNGFRVGQTRLTPTQVDIPALYLEETNVLRAHCWDTDKVESGFMAGLYLKDGGALRPVLLTGEGGWRVEGAPAEVRYYAHAQPDIPGAEVIWGRDLFGEVWLEAEFSAAAMQRAYQAAAVAPPPARRQPMAAHEVLSRMVGLEERRRRLLESLQEGREPLQVPRYRGYITGHLAFTLGGAGRLEESLELARRLHQWAERLPAAERQLVFRPPRPLKGVQAAVAARALEERGGRGEADRRRDYLPPPERGPGRRGHSGPGGGAPPTYALVATRALWGWWLSAAALLLYVALAGRHWWSLFGAEEWRR